jgi:REP element-mobilizing transposase RayT
MSKLIPLLPGKFYHILNRGNNRENIFLEERHYRCFLQLMEHIRDSHGCKIDERLVEPLMLEDFK